MTEEEMEALKQQLSVLRLEHRNLDEMIARLVATPIADELELRRLKKRKLYLKDLIFTMEGQLTPDIRA
ncbi:MAG: DUF465 domain-containing protein [Pseudomonadota bacterium]